MRSRESIQRELDELQAKIVACDDSTLSGEAELDRLKIQRFRLERALQRAA